MDVLRVFSVLSQEGYLTAVLKFQYPPTKCGTEIYVPGTQTLVLSSDHLIIKSDSIGIGYLNLSTVLTLNGGLYRRM